MSDAISNPLGRSSRAVPPEVCAAPLAIGRPEEARSARLYEMRQGDPRAGEGHMRAPDLKAYHVNCYDGRDSPYALPAPTMTAAAASLAVVMDADLDTLLLLGVMALAVAGCVLGWFLIGPRK
jgi:hypothetical protein